MARVASRIKQMSGLWRVRPTKALLWPHAFRNGREIDARGGAGYVVDMDKPWERVLCLNQEKNLEKVPEGQSPRIREIQHRGVIAWMVDRGWITRAQLRAGRGDKLRDNAEKQEPPATEGLPSLDEKPRTRRRKKEDEDAVPSASSDNGS